MASLPAVDRPAHPERPEQLDSVLRRGVETGVVTLEQAAQLAALAAAVAQPAPTAPRRPGRSPVLVEVLGYLGGALALAAGIFLAQELWADLEPWARAGILGVLASATGAAGALLRDAHGAAGRLASFLWLLTVPAAGGATAVLVDDLVEAESLTVALSGVTLATIVAWGLWALRRAPLQQAAAFVGLAVTGGMALVQVDDSLGQYVGYYIWAFGLAWLLLAFRHVVAPVGTAWVLGSIALVMGPLFVGDVEAMPWSSAALGLLSTGVLVAVAVRLRRIPVVVIGVLGLFQQVPRLLTALFVGQVAAPVVVLVSGVVLVGVSVVLARRSLTTGRDRPGPSGGAGAR